MTLPEDPTIAPARVLSTAVARAANLPEGRWSVRTEAIDIPELDEFGIQAIASVRVYVTAPKRDESSAVSPASAIQAAASKLGAELRAVIDAHDVDAETMRRLHEEATERAARLRLALEAIVRAFDGEASTLDLAIDAAREALDGAPLTRRNDPAYLRAVIRDLVESHHPEARHDSLDLALDTAREVLA